MKPVLAFFMHNARSEKLKIHWYVDNRLKYLHWCWLLFCLILWIILRGECNKFIVGDKLNCVAPAAVWRSSLWRKVTEWSSVSRARVMRVPAAFTENEAPRPSPCREIIFKLILCVVQFQKEEHYSTAPSGFNFLMRRRVRHLPKYCPVMQTRHPSLRPLLLRSVFRFNFLSRHNIRRKSAPPVNVSLAKSWHAAGGMRIICGRSECHRRAQS